MFWRPWLRSLQYVISTWSFCQRLHRDILYYLQTGCSVRSMLDSSQGVYSHERSRSTESCLHWFWCSSANTTIPLKWDRAEAFWGHSPLCGLWRRYTCLQQRGLDEHLGSGGHHLHILVLYRVGHRTEPCVHPCLFSLGVDISPSTETLNFLRERKELMILIIRAENSNFDNLYSRPGCQVVTKAFRYPRIPPP
jgi:hypothetical protein